MPVTGDFRGTLQGLHVRTVRLDKVQTVTLQSKWAGFAEGTGRQTVFLFGEANHQLFFGVLGLREAGSGEWSGTGDISVSGLHSGQFQVKLPTVSYDFCTLISAEPFEII